MAERSAQKIQVKNVIERAPVWVIGWLFTIGFAKLSFGKGLLALLIWPYYLGSVVIDLVGKQ